MVFAFVHKAFHRVISELSGKLDCNRSLCPQDATVFGAELCPNGFVWYKELQLNTLFKLLFPTQHIG